MDLFTSYWKNKPHIIYLLISLSVKKLFYLYDFSVRISDFRRSIIGGVWWIDSILKQLEKNCELFFSFPSSEP